MDQAPPTPGFFGREKDLERLTSLVGVGAAPPVSVAVLLAGDAGVGKTRLLAEFRVRAEKEGWRVVVGHCLDFGDSAPPYLPFTEVFGRLAAEAPALAASLLGDQPALARLMPGRRQLAEAEGRVALGDQAVPGDHIERADLFQAVHAGLQALGRSAPTLVVIEDIHWAERSTREMLGFLFTRLFDGPVSVVATYRSDDLRRRHPLRGTLGEWGRLPGVVRLTLQPLQPADIRAIVRSLHPLPLPEAQVRQIVGRAEGNAFFAEELVAAAAGSRGLPTDLVDLLLVRVDQLDEPVRMVVRAASVAGRRVTHELLARVVEADDAELEVWLRAAVDANVLVPAGDDAYAFRHTLLAEAVYDDLLPGERARLHGAYVRALTSRQVPGTAAELASHAIAAHDPATALRASIEAGDEAMAVAGPAEAAHHYENALSLLADTGSPGTGDLQVDRVALTVRAGDALVGAGNVFRAVTLLQGQLEQLPAGTTDEQRATLLVGLAGAALQGDTGSDALSATTEALRLVPAEPPSPLRARVANMHARSNADRGRDEEAARWAQVALDLARRFDLVDVATDATTTLAGLDERAGAPESSQLALEKAAEHAAEGGEVASELRALFNLAGLHYTLGHHAAAAEAYRKAADRARQHGRPWAPYGLEARADAAIVAYDNGDWEQALELVDVTGESPTPQGEALLAAVGMNVAAGRGEADAIALIHHLRPWWERDGQVAMQSAGAAIDLYGDAGRLREAIAVHDDVVATLAELWQAPLFQGRLRLAGLLLGQLCAAAARSSARERGELMAVGNRLADGAREVAAESLSLARADGVESAAWAVRVGAEHCRLRWLCQLDAPDGDEMVRAWEASVAAFGRFGHRFETARSQARLAAALRAVGRGTDAAAPAAEARDVARRLRARPLLDEVAALAPPPAATRAQVGPTADALTGREQEVLALVAEGRSNRDIADVLYISPKTVSVHVSNILAKLGAEGRTEAVAIARRRGLLPRGVGG